MVQPASDTVNTTAAIVRFGTSCPAFDNCGYWVLGTGYWVLGTGYWVLGTGYWVLGTGYWVLQNFEGKSLFV
ncbi:hypothetical protein NF212_12780 [Parasalinivibrio latis]|uniref:hypothetical protein n=1 Tax=Parasalinivibrio latis TaxID=2952610 RepID=UPI0030E0FB5D